jgi:hypothetical protein
MPDTSGDNWSTWREKKLGIKVLDTTHYTRNAIVYNTVVDPGTRLLAKSLSIEDLAVWRRKGFGLLRAIFLGW